jgi:2-dehydro-3-deoxyphosphogluconate aldolase/(4S)-4-hydroxy-2-oxoglutarate aldolase
MYKEIEKEKLIVILRNIPSNKILKVLEILEQENIKFVEITLNSKDALNQIKLAVENFSKKLIIGAGTIINLEDLKNAKNSGANFFLTPGIDEEVLKYGQENGLIIIPGFTTASEAMKAMKYGYNLLKLFPAGSFEKTYLRAMQGPLNNLKAMAVGGVNLENMSSFFNSGYVSVGVGGNIVPKKIIDNSDWDKLRKVIREYRNKSEEMGSLIS